MDDKSKSTFNCCTPAADDIIERNEKQNNSSDKKDYVGSIENCLTPSSRKALFEIHSTCVILLKKASQFSEHEWLAIFLFLLVFNFLLKVEMISMLLSCYFVGEYLKKYGRRNIFIFFGWVVTGCAIFFNVEKSVKKTYIFEECCSNVQHSPFLYEMTTSRNTKIRGIPYYVTQDFFYSHEPKPNLGLVENKIVENYLKCLRNLQLLNYFTSTSTFLLEMPLKFYGYFMNFLLLLIKIVLIPLSFKWCKTRCSTLVSYAITVCAAILLVTMDSKERHWNAEHRPPFVMEMRVQKGHRMRGLPYFVTKKYHDMQRNTILQQGVETSVVNYYEGNIRSCLSINKSIDQCLAKVIALIQRNDIVNLRLSLESSLYFNLYEANIRSCLRNMNSIENCVRQIIVEIQRNTDDYNKALNDLYEGKFACIQKVTAERQRNTITYYRPSLETLKSNLYYFATPIALSEYEVQTRISKREMEL